MYNPLVLPFLFNIVNTLEDFRGFCDGFCVEIMVFGGVVRSCFVGCAGCRSLLFGCLRVV